MKRSWWYRFTFMLAIVVISTLTILPTVFNYEEEGSYPIKSKINLGLDKIHIIEWFLLSRSIF